MKSVCGCDCNDCGFGKKENCTGCTNSGGCPFGKKCFIYDYIKIGGEDNFSLFKKQLCEEVNNLNIVGLPPITELFPINGALVNLGYRLPSGDAIKLLDDREMYLGNQVGCEFNDSEIKRFFGIVAGMDFLIVAEYDENFDNAELLAYIKR